MWRFCFIAVLLVAAGSIFGLDAEDYFPLGVGNTWTMQDSGETGYDTTVSSIIGTTTVVGYHSYIFWDEGDSEGDTIYFQMRPDGFYQVIIEEEMTMEMFLLPETFGIGDTWTIYEMDSTWVEGGMTHHRHMVFNGEALALENVTVPAGTFMNCLKMVMDGVMNYYGTMGTDTMYSGSNGFGNFMWLGHGIGPIKTFGWDFEDSDTTWDLGVLLDYDLSGIGENIANRPEGISIHSWPNPFNSSCRITAPIDAKIEIFDLNGRLIDKIEPVAGIVRTWAPSLDTPAGVYLIRANGEIASTARLLYIK